MRRVKKQGLHQNGGVGGHHSMVLDDHTAPNQTTMWYQSMVNGITPHDSLPNQVNTNDEFQ